MLALALVVAGCGPNVQGIVEALAQSERSWCFYWAGTPAFSGPFRVGGSGIHGGIATCTAETYTVNQGGMTAEGAPLVAPGGTVILPAPPRVFQQEVPTYREVPVAR